jgi:predicted GNAT family acetyltransferase
MSSTSVRHDAEGQRFVRDTAGGPARLDYRRDGDVVAFTHTFVPPEERGENVGTALVEGGLGWAREEGLKVVAQCPFVAAYVEEHAEAQDLLA